MTSAYRSSTATGSSSPAAAAMATICWASTSSALRGHHRGLDLGLAHPSRHHRALEQVRAELGEDAPAADVADRVAGTADPLQAAGHRLGRLHLDDQVHRAHVDPQLEARGGHQAGQLAGLEHLLHHRALLARQRAVVRAGQLLAGHLVQAQGHPLGAAAVVDEHDRRLVLADELEQLGIDRRPDRAPRGLAAGQRIEVRGRRRIGLDHRLDRHVDLQVELLAHAGVDDAALPLRPDHEPADLLERVLGRRQPDALHVGAGGGGEPLQRQRQVRAALGRGHGVDLVDDAPARALKQLLGLPGEHQVQRLGRGDEDVGRLAQHLLALALGRVAGAHRHLRSAPIPRSGVRRLRSTS